VKQIVPRKKEREQGKREQKERREEALWYLREVINANRAIKDWMLRNTFYAVTAEAGVFALLKKEAQETWEVMFAGVLLIWIWFVSNRILKSNRDSINKLRKKENDLITKTPLPWIEQNWAGRTTEKRHHSDKFYLNTYRAFILGTGIVLILFMWSHTPPGIATRTCLFAGVCPSVPARKP